MTTPNQDYIDHLERVWTAKARMDLVIRLLTRRFGPLDRSLKFRLAMAEDTELDAVAEELLTAPTLADAVKPLA